MGKNSVAEALRVLAGSQSRSEMARLRDVFDEVEAALSAGASHSAILETLREQGFTMTARTFESALYRLRKQRNDGKLAGRKEERVHVSNVATTESKKEISQNTVLNKPTSNDETVIAGKTKTEQVLSEKPKEFSFKQQQQTAKD